MTPYDVILKLCSLVKDEGTIWDILDAAMDGALIDVFDADEIKERLKRGRGFLPRSTC